MRNLIWSISNRIKGALWFLLYNGEYRWLLDAAVNSLKMERTKLADDGYVLHLELYPEDSGQLSAGYCGPNLEKYRDHNKAIPRLIRKPNRTVTTGGGPTTEWEVNFN